MVGALALALDVAATQPPMAALGPARRKLTVRDAAPDRRRRHPERLDRRPEAHRLVLTGAGQRRAEQQGRDAVRGQRAGEQPALALPAPEAAQRLGLPRRLDPVDDQVQPERLRHREDRGDECARVGVLLEPGGQRGIDLDAVDAKLLQVPQRRGAGAEVVEQHAGPVRPQLVDDAERATPAAAAATFR